MFARLSSYKVSVINSDTNGLSNGAVGVYYLMMGKMAHYGSLPNNAVRIAQILEREDPATIGHINEVLEKGVFIADAKDKQHIIHEDIEAQRLKEMRFRERCSAAGKTSVEKRILRVKKGTDLIIGFMPPPEQPIQQQAPPPETPSEEPVKKKRGRTKTLEHGKYYQINVLIIQHLNALTGYSYREDNKLAHTLLNGLFNNKYTPDDVKSVIEAKTRDWKGSEYEQHLTPATLFGKKFDMYVQQARHSRTKTQRDTDKIINIGRINFEDSFKRVKD